MTRRVFTTAGWNQTGDPIVLGEIDGVQTISYLTIDKAVDACVDGDVVEPCRPGMPGFSFVDADGLPLKTVVVPLGAHLTINKSITLQGGWCRLRLDGGGTRAVGWGRSSGSYVITDVDFVGLTNLYDRASYMRVVFTRCFLSSRGFTIGYAHYEVYDSVIITRAFTTSALYQNYFYRTVFSLNATNISTFDCIRIDSSATQAELDALFVSPPKARDQTDTTKYADLTEWGDNDYQNIDLRLLPTSEYASGATSVQSGQEVYDLAGFKRKVGGALGAYEVLDATPTHYPCESRKGWKYAVTRDDATTPVVKYACMYKTPTGNSTHIELDAASSARFSWSYFTNDAWTPLGSTVRILRTTASQANRLFRVTSDATETESSQYTTIQFYTDEETAPADAVPCKFLWSDGRFFTNASGTLCSNAERPTSESVVYIDANVQFVDAASQNVGKIIQEGFVHTDLGGAEGEIILGRDSTAKTCGKLTWRGQTTTSAAALARVVPREPAELTFKECNISD